jgi:hypothetical protein
MGEFVQPRIKEFGGFTNPDIRRVVREIGEGNHRLISHMGSMGVDLNETHYLFQCGGASSFKLWVENGSAKQLEGNRASGSFLWHPDIGRVKGGYEPIMTYLACFPYGLKILGEGRIPGLDCTTAMPTYEAYTHIKSSIGQDAVSEAISDGLVEVIDAKPATMYRLPPWALHRGPTEDERSGPRLWMRRFRP